MTRFGYGEVERPLLRRAQAFPEAARYEMSEDSVFGRFRLLAQIGRGGMADVFLAVVQGPGGFSKLQVIKRLRLLLQDDPDFIAMLVDEARLAGRLNHPNIVQTNEVGDVDGQYFISMEYLDGQPLHRVMDRARRAKVPLDRKFYGGAFCDVLAGLHYAHELVDYAGNPLGVVHRDVTPHNIFVTYDGVVKLVDFGIAKAMGRMTATTKEGVIKGKIAYMAPEQAMGLNVDRRADIFAVGMMLWEAVVGHRMWHGQDDMAVLRRLMDGDLPRSPKAANPEVPAGLDEICSKALAPKPSDRYATAADMQADLEQYLLNSQERISSRLIGKAVADLFAKERAEVTNVVRSQLAELEAAPTADFKPVVIGTVTRAATGSGSGLDQNTRTGHTAITGVDEEVPKEDATVAGTTTGAKSYKDGSSEFTPQKSLSLDLQASERKRKSTITIGVVLLIAAGAPFIFLRRSSSTVPDPHTTSTTTNATNAVPTMATTAPLVPTTQVETPPPAVPDAGVSSGASTSAPQSRIPGSGRRKPGLPTSTTVAPPPSAVPTTQPTAPPREDDGLSTRK